jgi:glycosyltransferase A (GT-A) superfamily protein (DUF2064 family)
VDLLAAHVLVMAKAPRPGFVKTRLCPPCTRDEAAEVGAAALADTLEAVAGCRAARKVVALEGPSGDWLPPGFEVVPQRGTSLAERLANAWSALDGPGIQIGMYTPQVSSGELDMLLDLVTTAPPRTAVLGHAVDGGWWVIGWRRAAPDQVFVDIPTSTPQTGALQHARLLALGFDVTIVQHHVDIDTFDDLQTVARLAPSTRTAVVAARLLASTPDDGRTPRTPVA